MTRDGVIGRNGSLPWHHAADLRRFKQVTSGSTIIMGRRTWDSLPIKPLPNRQNIVLSRLQRPAGAEHRETLEEAVQAAQCDRVWFIGGASIYAQAIDCCEVLDVTYVPDQIETAQSLLFPAIDWSLWRAGPIQPLAADSALINQIFTRPHNTL